MVAPTPAIRSNELEADAAALGRLIGKLGANVERLLRTYQMAIVDRQYHLGRVADAAIEIYASACVLNRLDALIRQHHGEEANLRGQLETGRYYLATASRRIRRALADLWDNDDEATTSLANRMLRR